MAALAGSAIGGLTSFATSWSTQHAQAKVQRVTEANTKREALYGKFINEASRLFADARQNQQKNATNLAALYTLINRMRLMSSSQIIEAAESVTKVIVDTYLAPDKRFEDFRELMVSNEMDPCERSAKLAGGIARPDAFLKAHLILL